MFRGVYHAGAAMLAALIKQDIHVHNLVNANTNGFRRILARVVTGTRAEEWPTVVTRVDVTQGDIRPTGSPLDVALRGNGLFVLDTGAGRQFTRNGNFTLDAQGYLVNRQGYRVLGQRGPIRLTGKDIQISTDGGVYSDGRRVDTLLVVDFGQGVPLGRAPGSAVTGNPGPAQVARVTLEPGALEASNAKPGEEMMQMRVGLRVYEANARVISQVDRSLGKLVEATTS